MITAIIIEDEKKSAETLKGLLARYCPNVEIIEEASGYREGIEKIRLQQPDVVFLDIQMPDGSGFKVLEELKGFDFEVIFTTAFDQFAIKAIKYSALDYLLKPIDPEELVQAVKKVEMKKSESRKNMNIEAFLENIKTPSEDPHKIVLSTSEKIHVIDVSDIIRCESDNYYTHFFFTNGTKILVSKTLKENEQLLSNHNFIRPHKSHLINIKYIKSFIRQDGGYIVMSDGSKVPVSRRKKERIMEVLLNL
jgi:two-component system LytT family response regulator